MSSMPTSATVNAPDRATSQPPVLQRYWGSLAYHHRLAEAALYLLFVTGLPLWNIFTLPWQGTRALLFAHVVAGLLLFPLSALPFWLSHRRLLQNSHKPKLKKTGQLIEWLLIFSALSGVYLLLLGNRGEWLGVFNHYIHLITAIPFAILLLIHAWRWSVLQSVIKPLLKTLLSTVRKVLR
ncbi:MAG: hypothetical protein V7707_01175 [Motiliproteus sp.]